MMTRTRSSTAGTRPLARGKTRKGSSLTRPRSPGRSPILLGLRKELASIGRDLTEFMRQVLGALEDRDDERARRIINDLRNLQEREDALKDRCVQILATGNASTPERRWTECTHRVVCLLEQSASELVSIAREILEIKKSPALPIAGHLPRMGRVAGRMLRKSIRTTLRPDRDAARRIMETDSRLDRQKEAFMKKAIAFMMEHPNNSEPVVAHVLVSRHLERIGDHASHIAEEVAYYIQEQAA